MRIPYVLPIRLTTSVLAWFGRKKMLFYAGCTVFSQGKRRENWDVADENAKTSFWTGLVCTYVHSKCVWVYCTGMYALYCIDNGRGGLWMLDRDDDDDRRRRYKGVLTVWNFLRKNFISHVIFLLTKKVLFLVFNICNKQDLFGENKRMVIQYVAFFSTSKSNSI